MPQAEVQCEIAAQADGILTYQAPKRLLQPSSLALGTTWNEVAVPARNVASDAKAATPVVREAVFSLSCTR